MPSPLRPHFAGWPSVLLVVANFLQQQVELAERIKRFVIVLGVARTATLIFFLPGGLDAAEAIHQPQQALGAIQVLQRVEQDRHAG